MDGPRCGTSRRQCFKRDQTANREPPATNRNGLRAKTAGPLSYPPRNELSWVHGYCVSTMPGTVSLLPSMKGVTTQKMEHNQTPDRRVCRGGGHVL